MMKTLYTNQAMMRSLEVVIIIQSSGPGTNYSKAHPAGPEALDDLSKTARAAEFSMTLMIFHVLHIAGDSTGFKETESTRGMYKHFLPQV